MIKVQKIFVMAALVLIPSVSFAQKVNILTEKTASNREQYAAEYLQKKLNRLGFPTVVNGKKGEYRISLSQPYHRLRCREKWPHCAGNAKRERHERRKSGCV